MDIFMKNVIQKKNTLQQVTILNWEISLVPFN